MRDEFDEYDDGYGEHPQSLDNTKFLYCPDGTAIHVDQIGSMRRVGFTVIGATAIGERTIAHFDSVHEAKAFLKWITMSVPTDATEEAEKLCKAALCDYFFKKFMPFAVRDLYPLKFDDIWVEACKPDFGHNITNRMLSELTKEGNIACYGGKWSLPDRPTQVAVQRMTDRMYAQYYRNGTYKYNGVCDSICKPTSILHLDYLLDWGRSYIKALVSIGWAEIETRPDETMLKVNDGPEADGNYAHDTSRIEQELDQMDWKAIPELKEGV